MALGVSVGWLIEQRQLGLAVLAGASELDRRIEWVHSIELADPAPWLRGGELLLTTGLHLPADGAGQRGYVDSLHLAGVAALGFGIGLSHTRVPDAMLAAADDVGLPLLQVPLPTPFIAVARAVTERIAEQQYEGVTRASRIQPRMTRAALYGGIRAVVKELATATGGRVLLLADDNAVVAAYPRAARQLAGAVVSELRLDARTGSTAEPAGLASAGPDRVVTGQRLQVGRRLHGHLVLVTAGPPTPIDHLLLGHAASLVCLEQEQPLRLRETQNRFNEMVTGLLLDRTLTGDQAAEQLRIAGLAVRDGFVVLAVGSPDARLTLTALDQALLDRDRPCIGAVSDGHAVVLLPAEPVALSDDLIDAVSRADPALVVHGGRARPTGQDGFADSAGLAISAARVATLRGVPLVDGESIAGQALIAAPAVRSAFQGLAEQRLRPLAQYDLTNDSDLVRTLRAFLEHNGHWEAASTALGIHRHTLHNRVHRIEAMLGVDLDSAHVRAELLLCLLTWR